MKPSRLWYIGFISVALLFSGYSVYREVTYGIGQWNRTRPLDGLGYHQLRIWWVVSVTPEP